MHPHLFSLPIWVFAALLGGAMGASFSGKTLRAILIGGAAGTIIAGTIAFMLPVGKNLVPIQGYGVMILIGYFTAIILAEGLARKIGIKAGHVLDMGLTGCLLGLI